MSGAPSPAGSPRPNVGGQAVIEGVMMRSPKSFAVVCRLPDGGIVVKEQEWRPLWSGVKVFKWPLFRGGIVLLESLVNGVSALTFSANQQMEAEEKAAREAEEAKTAPPDPGIPEAVAKEKPRHSAAADSDKSSGPFKSLGARGVDQPDESSHLATFGMVAVSLVFGLALFVGAPHLVAWGLGSVLGFDASSFVFHAVDGIIKLIILIGYLAAISLLPDVRRVFQYHGAEHKAIFTYEKGLPLTVDNAREQTRFHPRCGTSFLLIVIMVSVALFSALLTYRIADSTALDHILKILIKIPLMFPIAGIAYELIRIAGKKMRHQPDRAFDEQARHVAAKDHDPRAGRLSARNRFDFDPQDVVAREPGRRRTSDWRQRRRVLCVGR